MKKISNIFKVLIVVFIMYQYHRLSSGGALSSDNCKGLLFIGIACFFVLCPVDASIFAKNVLLCKGKFRRENMDNINNKDKKREQPSDYNL